ncbi:putative BPI/LBP family protein [Tanacetum coccineum]
MELENSQNNALAKLPMLKLGEYEMWEIRIKQYFQIQDYALWEVIENGNSWVPIPVTTPESGPSTALKMTVPSTTEEKICKKNDVKARSLLLMALPNEHQLTFNHGVASVKRLGAVHGAGGRTLSVGGWGMFVSWVEGLEIWLKGFRSAVAGGFGAVMDLIGVRRIERIEDAGLRRSGASIDIDPFPYKRSVVAFFMGNLMNTSSVKVEGMEIGMTLGLKNEQGTLRVSPLDYGCYVNYLSIILDGGASWLYQGIVDFFSKDIAYAIEDTITSKVKQAMIQLDSVIQSLPKQVSFGDTATLNVTVTDGPIMSSTSLLIGKQNFLDVDNLPVQKLLNTSGWRFIIPKLYKEFPNDGMSLNFTILSPPIIKVENEGIVATVKSDVFINVVDAGEVIPVAYITMRLKNLEIITMTHKKVADLDNEFVLFKNEFAQHRTYVDEQITTMQNRFTAELGAVRTELTTAITSLMKRKITGLDHGPRISWKVTKKEMVTQVAIPCCEVEDDSQAGK